MAGKNMGRSTFRRKGVTGQVKTHHPKGTVCGAKGCTTFISIYNPDPIARYRLIRIDSGDDGGRAQVEAALAYIHQKGLEEFSALAKLW